MLIYKQASESDAEIIANFELVLYTSDNTFEKLYAETIEHLRSSRWAVFMAFDDSAPAGFCKISLRSDYVEGTDGGVVGYVEGVFVLPDYRGKHIAKTLISLGEDWSRKQGCSEFASDCMLNNTDSLHFHLKVGFEEAGRNIHFVKKL